MIRVTVQLISAIDGSTETLGMMDICNRGDRTHADPLHNYDGSVYKKGSDPLQTFRKGKVENYARAKWNVWVLVKKMLDDIYKEHNQVAPRAVTLPTKRQKPEAVKTPPTFL